MKITNFQDPVDIFLFYTIKIMVRLSKYIQLLIIVRNRSTYIF